ncbi:hypothetical protein COLO4_02034 [Corchorus olitorius]|uniref:Uncharacterized protein n=1 Tax=Corchorus olitorius TaxID=93759 RepID=A0A1R3L1L3_9ROSI|nr:hypothetical protein COLO4_02034 [Corchorus olitorius]
MTLIFELKHENELSNELSRYRSGVHDDRELTGGN